MKNEKGFTLLELMVALGIGSFVILVITQVMNRSSVTMRNAEQATSVNEIIFTATSLLEKQGSCSQSTN